MEVKICYTREHRALTTCPACHNRLNDCTLGVTVIVAGGERFQTYLNYAGYLVQTQELALLLKRGKFRRTICSECNLMLGEHPAIHEGTVKRRMPKWRKSEGPQSMSMERIRSIAQKVDQSPDIDPHLADELAQWLQEAGVTITP